MAETILEVKDLSITFFTKQGALPTVDGVSFTLNRGETLGIVGESGCGKSMTVNGILQMVPAPGRVTGGSVKLAGEELVGMREKELCRKRGSNMAIIFQEPMTSLNPTMRIGKQVEESLRIHEKLSRAERKARALDAMALAGLPDPESVYSQYPHQLSGGMRQRVMIASALVLRPRLLIADEPTTALDVTIQAQILETLKDINRKEGTAILFISHDLGVVKALCGRVVVMTQGKIVESGAVDDVFYHPRAEYTKLLIASRPARKKLRGGGQDG